MIVSPSVFRVLPVAIHGISQIPKLISAYLLPRTIDAAVYKDLRTVVRVYGDFLPWTVGAMNGAATRGRLDICRTLQSTRSEGCSIVAFTGAVLNGHLESLRWLIEHYPDLYDPEKCLTTAVSEGQADVVRYLNQRRGNYVKTPYLEIAAVHGDVEVIEALRPWADDPDALAGPLQLALLHNQEQVYHLLIESFTRDDARRLNNLGLDVAAMFGKTKMVKLLLRKGAVSAENMATHNAAKNGHLDVVEILLAECKLPQLILSNALSLAVSNDHCAVVESLLKHFVGQKEDEEETKGGQVVKSCVGSAFRASARRGSINMVKALLGRCPDDILGQELREAGTTGKIEVAKLLLSECERRHLEDSVYIAAVVQKAAQCRDLEMAKLLVHCGCSTNECYCEQGPRHVGAVCTDKGSVSGRGSL